MRRLAHVLTCLDTQKKTFAIVHLPAFTGFNDLHNGLTLFVDIDKGNPQEGERKLVALLGPSTITVASGGVVVGDDGVTRDKLHIQWRLKEPTRDAAGHALLKRLRALACDLVGGDASGVNPVHPFRAAGSVHRKSTPRLADIVSESDHEIDLHEGLAILERAAVASGGTKQGALVSQTERLAEPLTRATLTATTGGPTLCSAIRMAISARSKT